MQSSFGSLAVETFESFEEEAPSLSFGFLVKKTPYIVIVHHFD